MKNASAIKTTVTNTIASVSSKLNSDIIHIGKYAVNPTGIIVRSKTLDAPLNIPSGYVAKFVTKLFPVSATISDLPNQKLKLPRITANDVIIKPPVIEKKVNNKNFVIVIPLIASTMYPYKISPIADT